MLTALACPFLSQSPADPAWVVRIGRGRASYGDIPNSGEWKYVLSSQFGGTTILYRAGSATERYYLSCTSGSGKRRLSKTTLVNGVIRKDWMIHMKDSGRTSISHPGSLWNFAVAGHQVIGEVPKEALKDLQSVVPLAGYKFNIHAPFCFVVFEGGEPVGEESWILSAKDADTLPRTSDPYPISQREVAYLKRGRRTKSLLEIR